MRAPRDRDADRDAMGLVGLARRAGAVVSGVEGSREAVRTGSALLVILAADAAPGQLKKVRGLLAHREVPVRWVPSQVGLGRSVGRSIASVVAITSHSFADQLMRRLPAHPSGVAARDASGQPKEKVGTDAGR